MQNSFSSGELSPTMFGRVDLDKYHVGLQTCRNAYVDYRGGITRRPGTRMVGSVDSSNRPRLIPFTFSSVQTYVLVFTDGKLQVIRNGGFVTEPAIAMTRSGTTYTSTAHGLSTGNEVVVSDIVPWLIVTVIDADHFTLTDLYTGNLISSNATTFARIFTLSTPWAAADLPLLKFTQSFDTMTLTHPSYTPRNLTRTQHWVWTLNTITIGSTVSAPTISGLTGFSTGTIPAGAGLTSWYGYVVTAVDADGQESIASTEVDIQYYNRDVVQVTIRVAWGVISGAARYNVYAAIPANGVGLGSFPNFGYIGSTKDTLFTDTNIQPDFSKVPPTPGNPIAGNNPGVSTYFDQRKVYAATNSNPQTLYMSKPAQYNNFDTSQPANDGDGLTLTLSTIQSAQIRALLPMPDGMLAFTQNGVFKISGGGTNTGIKVSSVLARPQNYIGINNIPPIPVNFEILFVQEKGAIIRALAYNFYTNTYEPADLTLLSNHLFLGHTIMEWAYAEHPNKLIWCVRDDGQLLSLTYLKDQKIQGWAHHDTFGVVESVASISELGTDGVYIAVRRLINGTWYRFIEELQSTDISKGVENAWYVDAGLDYGSIFPVATLKIAGATGAAVVNTAPDTPFTSGDVGKVIRAAGGVATVTGFNSTSQLNINWTRAPTDLIQPDPQSTTPVGVRDQVAGTWSIAAPVTTLTGLNHLINTQVSYLADGVPGKATVSSTGTLTLSVAASRVIAGLGYRTQCQTLDLEPGGGASMQGKRKKIVAVTAKVQNTGALQYGPNFNELTTWSDVYGDRLSNLIMTGDQPLGLNQFYDYGGRVCWQQDLPLPMTILSLVPEISVGD